MSVITSLTKSTMRGAIENFAKKELKCDPKEVQLKIYTKDNDTALPRYDLIRNFKDRVREVTFSEILGVSWDPLNREAMATPFLAKAIMSLAAKNQTIPTEVNVFVIYNAEQPSTPNLFLYKGMQQVRYLNFETDIFGEEKPNQ